MSLLPNDDKSDITCDLLMLLGMFGIESADDLLDDYLYGEVDF